MPCSRRGSSMPTGSCRRQGDDRRRRAGSIVAGVARADGRDSRRLPIPARKSNSAASRSCWADARCRISPPTCTPTPSPGPSTGWIFARPAPPMSPQRHRHAAGPVRQFPRRARRRIVRSGYAGRRGCRAAARSAFRSQKPLQLRGKVSVGRGPRRHRRHEGRDRRRRRRGPGCASPRHRPDGGSRIDAELKADRLDLDAATAFVRVAGGPAGRVAGRGGSSRSISATPVSAGQELHPFIGQARLRPERRSRSIS